MHCLRSSRDLKDQGAAEILARRRVGSLLPKVSKVPLARGTSSFEFFRSAGRV